MVTTRIRAEAIWIPADGLFNRFGVVCYNIARVCGDEEYLLLSKVSHDQMVDGMGHTLVDVSLCVWIGQVGRYQQGRQCLQFLERQGCSANSNCGFLGN